MYYPKHISLKPGGYHETYVTDGSVDFKPILSKVRTVHPDVIYMVSYVMDASLLMKQIKELRIDAKLFCDGAAGFAIPEFIENAQDASEYVVSATLWTPQVKYPGAQVTRTSWRPL